MLVIQIHGALTLPRYLNWLIVDLHIFYESKLLDLGVEVQGFMLV